ncbi:ATP-binding protein [Streptomyces fuscichromogenes]|uniref:ATP-binding protein n=1 Tax=Streptomyces fuscichromogenes TaxID=1324013 RepID=UPI0037F60613
MTTAIRSLGSLPVPFAGFVGRHEEMAEVRRLLDAVRLVTLTGAGGVGKSRLALEAAASSAEAFPGGVRLADLAPVKDPLDVPSTVAVALGLPDQGTRPVLDMLTAHVGGRRMLLVLDNCEHVVDACAWLTRHLLSAAAGARILATSREAMGLTGEQVCPVPPLRPGDAVELLSVRTAAVRSGFEVTEANRAAVTRLCAKLDGLPLAIELAASRLRTLTVEQVSSLLDDRFALLTSGNRVARAHQRTLRATIDWSWELCSPAERLLWQRLSVFPRSFTLDAAESVCAGEGIARHDILHLLDRLVIQSLVERPGDEDPPRYRLLESIRQYGSERLAEYGEAQRVRRSHRSFFLDLAEHFHTQWFGPHQVEILARLRAEHANLMAALEHRDCAGTESQDANGTPDSGSAGGRRDASAPGDRQAGLALASALVFHWVVGGFLGEGRRQLERALAAAPEPTEARARALWAAAHVAERQHDLGVADRWLDEAEALTGLLGDARLRAHVRGHRGVAALFRGKAEEGISSIEQALATCSSLGDSFGEIVWLSALAVARIRSGDPRGQETARLALAASVAHGERWARVHLLMVLSRSAWEREERAEAEELTVSALEILRDFGDRLGVARMVEQLAWITAAEGDHEKAGRLLGAAESLGLGTGMSVPASDEGHHTRCEAAVRKALGLAGQARVRAEGAEAADVSQALALALARGTADGSELSPSAPNPLTPREQQVAALVAQGMTNRRIAEELVLSRRTVDSHVDRIRTKLDFASRAQIAAWWAEHQAATQRPQA